MSEEQEQKNGAAEAVTTSNPEDFSLDRLKSHFETCLGEDNSINIDKYLLGKNFCPCLYCAHLLGKNSLKSLLSHVNTLQA